MTEDERAAAEMRGLLGFARGLGLDETAVREIYKAVGREAAAAGAIDDDRMAEVQKQMLATNISTRRLVSIARRLTEGKPRPLGKNAIWGSFPKRLRNMSMSPHNRHATFNIVWDIVTEH